MTDIIYPEIKPCPKCRGLPILCEPNYADDHDTMVVCENCDFASNSFTFGEYREGSIAAINDWNHYEEINMSLPEIKDQLSRFKAACEAIRPHPQNPHKPVPAAEVARFIDVECVLILKTVMDFISESQSIPEPNVLAASGYNIPVRSGNIRAYISEEEALHKGFHLDQIHRARANKEPLDWPVVVEDDKL